MFEMVSGLIKQIVVLEIQNIIVGKMQQEEQVWGWDRKGEIQFWVS